MNRIADAAEQEPNLIVDSASGSRFCRGEAILFFPKQPPGMAERVVIEKAQAVLSGLEGAACNPSLAQVEQVGPNLFLAELIGRAAIMRGKAAETVSNLGVV